MAAQIIKVDFRTKKVLEKVQPVVVTVWQCSFCKGDYSHTEGSDSNAKCVVGGSEKHPARICEECAAEIYHLMGGSNEDH